MEPDQSLPTSYQQIILEVAINEEEPLLIDSSLPYRYLTKKDEFWKFTISHSAAIFEEVPKWGLSQCEFTVDYIYVLHICDLLKCRIQLEELGKPGASSNKTDASNPTPSQKFSHEARLLLELFKTNEHLIRQWDHRNAVISSLTITWDDLGHIFNVGDLVMNEDCTISRLKSISIVPEIDRYGSTLYMTLITESVGFDGSEIRYSSQATQVPEFIGERDIVDLELYPLSFHGSEDEIKALKAQCTKRGQKYFKLIAMASKNKSNFATCEYSGYGYINDDSNGRNSRNKERTMLSSRFILDPQKLSDFTGNLENRNGEPEPSPDNPEDMLCCKKWVECYNLSISQWCTIPLDGIIEPTWIQKMSDRYACENPLKNQISRLKRLVKAHIARMEREKNIEQSRDQTPASNLVKGAGLTVLLYGPPGTGKTMLVECIADVVRRPLYRINITSISSSVARDQELDDALRQAYRWGAIVIIDEAEIVMAERSLENTEQSAWVAAFLAKIEYFRGIIFLTTNQVHSIDPAFESRIVVGIQFNDVAKNEKHMNSVWQKCLSGIRANAESVKSMTVDEKGIMEWVEKKRPKNLNARQIHNIVNTAALLCYDQHGTKELTSNDVNDAYESVVDFMDIVRKEKKRKEDEIFQSWN